MRPAPVDGLVGHVRNGRECAGSPAEDSVIDLEAPSDDPAQLGPGPVHDRIASERLADRHDVPDGQPGRPCPRVVAPRIAQVDDDDMTRRCRGRKLDRGRPIHEDPAAGSGPRPEVEREAVEDALPGRQAAERRSVFGMEASRDVGLGRVPRRVEIDGPREGAGERHPGRFRSADGASY